MQMLVVVMYEREGPLAPAPQAKVIEGSNHDLFTMNLTLFLEECQRVKGTMKYPPVIVPTEP